MIAGGSGLIGSGSESETSLGPSANHRKRPFSSDSRPTVAPRAAARERPPSPTRAGAVAARTQPACRVGRPLMRSAVQVEPILATMTGMHNPSLASGKPPQRLTLVICGVPASGKSTLAARAATALGLPIVSSDLVRKELARVKPSDRASPEHYTASFSQRVYAELGRRAADHVHACGGVIVDATFRSRQNREAFAGTFGAAAPRLFVECSASLRVLLERAKVRDRDPDSVSDATTEVVASQYRLWQPLDEVPTGHHVTIDTTQRETQVEAQLAIAIQNFISGPGMPPEKGHSATGGLVGSPLSQNCPRS